MLNGSGNDPDGSVASYQWTKISGPSSYIINSASQAQTSIGNLTQGVYQFELRVTDNVGAIGRDTVIVTVNPVPNTPPLVNAGADQTITLPVNTTILNGAASDADGNIVNYTWTKISGPTQYLIASQNQSQTALNNLVEGVYHFELTVMDNQGAIGRDTVAVTVIANIAPTVTAGDDQTITLPVNSVTFAGIAADLDGTIVSYEWSKIFGPAQFVIVSSSQPQTIINNLLEGIYRFELTVTDNRGGVAKDTVQVTVNARPNMAPVAKAGIDQTITLPLTTVLVRGSGTDVDGTIVSYLWSKISGPASYIIGNPSSAQTFIHTLEEGVYQFELMVTDNDGGIGKDTIMITVNAAGNLPPVAVAGPDQDITLPTNSVTLSGIGTDADGTIIGYSWTKIAGPGQFNIALPAQAQTAVNNLVEGVYQFELKVTDNQGAVGRDTVTVFVHNTAINTSTATLYPNPASTTINVKIDAITHRNQTKIRIYDVRGVLVYEEEFLRTQPIEVRQINISKLLSGSYILRVGADINNDIALKFIKE
jgi:hypothetical protein